MSGKKTVRRSVAISLGLMCIVLIALVAYLTVISISAQNSCNNLQNENVQLQTWLDANVTLLAQTQANNTSLQNQNTNLTNQVNDLTVTLNLGKSTVWVDNQTVSQQAGNYTDFHFQVSGFAGYVSVNVTSSTTDRTYVEVSYSGHVIPSGIFYDNTRTVGKSGTVDFPFVVEPVFTLPFGIPLPTIIEIRVGNTNTVDNATETVTITYHY